MTGQAEIAGPLGGRHQRARALARRRSGCEPVSDYEQRLLRAHLGACPRCRVWAEALPGATVRAGQGTHAPATVSPVEAAGTASNGEQGEHLGSEVDAMGQDKRRAVVGQGYGPTKGRQLVYYGIFLGFLVLLYFGGMFAISQLDKAPSHDPASAPWAQPPAKQQQAPEQFQ
jgi:hypothetical protein